MSTIVLDGGVGLDATQLRAILAEHHIASRPFFDPLSSLPAFANHRSARHGDRLRPNAHTLGRGGLNLPSALTLTRSDVDRVCDVVAAALNGSTS
jgi:perosamine synthetase